MDSNHYTDVSEGFYNDNDDDASRSQSPIENQNSESSPNSKGKVDLKICGVCGDKALGNNFNAITCESCKAFFRRNALKPKAFVCPFNDNCKMDPITRRFCQKCRLKKCFDIGMKKEWIMTDEEKKMKKEKIEKNRLKRQSSDNPQPLDMPSNKTICVEDDGFKHSISRHHVSQNSQQSDQCFQQQPHSQKVVKQPMMPHNHQNQNLQQQQHLTMQPGQNDGNEEMFLMHSSAEALTMLHDNNITNSSKNNNNHPSSINSNFPLLLQMNIPQNEQNDEAIRYNTNASITSSCSIQPKNKRDNRREQEKDNSCWNSSPTGVKIDPNKSYSSSPQTEEDNYSIVTLNCDNNVGQSLASGDVEDGQSLPLLSSLIRPGVAESPPDENLIHCRGSNLNNSNNNDNNIQINDDQISQQNMPASSHIQIIDSQNQPSPSSHPQHEMEDFQMAGCKNLMENGQYLDENPLPLPYNTMDSILSVAITAEFNSFGILGRTNLNPLNPPSRQLNKVESAKLSEIFLAGQSLNAPVDAERPNFKETTDPSLINVINLTDIAIRRLIKMSKKISGFKNMCQDDQVALLKGSCTEMMILRSAVSYDPDRDSWKIPHSNRRYNINLGILKEAGGNLYEEHQRFIRSFKQEWRSDENIMTILCAITLFTPERPNVIHKDVVKLEQDSYYYLLKRYLESRLNGCEATSTYLQLIRKIAELHILNQNHLRVFLEVNPRLVEPLLIEIFDLKQ